MLDNELKSYLLPNLFNAAVRAGAAIMQVYKNKEDYDISIKSDKTPITVADRRAHETIKTYLGPTRIPILSEEGREMRYEERCNWELFWLVDPLDGTVEFIKGNNEFTVNIALMENNRSVASVVYVPYLGKMYLAWRRSDARAGKANRCVARGRCFPERGGGGRFRRGILVRADRRKYAAPACRVGAA